METAKQLAARGAKVYLLCRNEDKAKEAIRDLARQGIPANLLHFLPCDLTDLASVRECAAKFLLKEKSLDILINNAAVLHDQFKLTKDGHELVWQSNYLGHFLLTELLLPALYKSTDGRIVHISARLANLLSELDLDKVDDKRHFGGRRAAYSRSKLAQILNARELTKRLRVKGIDNVTVNSCHPGVINTNLSRSSSTLLTLLLYAIRPITIFTMKTASSGVQTALYLALSTELNGASGKYYRDCTEETPSALAQNDALAKELYDLSRKQVGLD